MFCIFCENNVEEFEFNCTKHKTCPCGLMMLDCSESIAYKQIASYSNSENLKGKS